MKRATSIGHLKITIGSCDRVRPVIQAIQAQGLLIRDTSATIPTIQVQIFPVTDGL